MNIFTDWHHGDLYYSLHLLFEERLKMNLFRPIGMEWFEKGFWKIAEPYGNAPDTIGQYLRIPPIITPFLKYGEIEFIDGVYHVPIKVGTDYCIHKAITFDKFLSMDIDVVLATYPGHELAYSELVRRYKPNAIYISHIGNTSILPVHSRNVMLAINTPMPPGVNWIKYHPEHHRDYSYTPPTNHNVIKSFMADPLHERDIGLFYEYERQLPEFSFRMHGGDGREGAISGDLMPDAIKDSAFVWHVKRTGCGGFIPRQALSCGRPCIIKKSYCYEYHTLERDLFQDSVNCIDLDLGTTQQNIEKIRYFSEPSRHAEMCRNTAEKFKRDVNFDAEAERIREFINNLLRR